MLKLNDKSKKKYHTNIKRGTFEAPLFYVCFSFKSFRR